jgi:hypothetical protein
LRLPYAWSNEFLGTRKPHTGVAQHSLHMQAEAIDIRLRGIPTSELRDVALRLHRGGVGYYRSSHFVHVDVGRVRYSQLLLNAPPKQSSGDLVSHRAPSDRACLNAYVKLVYFP